MNTEFITAQCFLFFIAGFENTSSVLCFSLFELSQNVDIQNKVYNEITSVLGSSDGVLSFDNILKLKYLDMFVSEIIRKYAPATAIIRMCTKDYLVPEHNITIEKGVQVVIPVCGLHADPRYFKDPDVFDPERFSDEAKLSRPQFAYIPFGDGPRYCIGRRFGITQIKVALITLLQSFEFKSSEKMKLPIKYERKTFITSMEGGTWVKCIKR